MKIFGWALNHSGCGQYRIGLPMWALERAGHDATAFSVLDTELPGDLDVLVGQQVFDHERSGVWQAVANARDRRTALVFETDDDVWNIHATNIGGRAFRDPDVLRALEANIRAADAVTVTTDRLAEVVSAFADNVHVIPNCVDASLLERRHPANERLTIGWAGGDGHSNDFTSAGGPIRSFLRRTPSVDLHLIGADYRRALGRPEARHSTWRTNLTEYLSLLDFDIGIAPIAYHAFNKSKSDLKALEYAALGIPVVATDFGPYSESVQHGVTGFLVKRPHEWAHYLRDLVNDDAMRLEMGENARRWAATRTVQGNIWRWEEAYRSAVGAAAATSGEVPSSLADSASTPATRLRGTRPKQKPKVFVIGHNKTGTTSVEAALAALGLRMGNQARGELLLDDWATGRYDRIIALGRSADAFQDIPFSLWGTYRALDAAFPGAKFILTMRGSSQEWYQSTLAWGRQLTHPAGPIPTAAEMRAVSYRAPDYFLKAHKLIYGVDEDSLYDEKQYVAAYEMHNHEVMRHFAKRPGSLLTLNVASTDAFARLCSFLEIDPGENTSQMPWLNRTDETARRATGRNTPVASEQPR